MINTISVFVSVCLSVCLLLFLDLSKLYCRAHGEICQPTQRIVACLGALGRNIEIQKTSIPNAVTITIGAPFRMFTIVILNVYVTKCHKGHSCTLAIQRSVARYSTHLLSPLFFASLIPHPPPRLCQLPLPVYPNYPSPFIPITAFPLLLRFREPSASSGKSPLETSGESPPNSLHVYC